VSSLRGPSVTLVPLERRHLDRTREWANDPELMRLLDRTRTVSPEEHERWFAALGAANDRLFMAIEHTETGRHIGNVWLWDIDERHRKAEIRIVIGDGSFAGQGVGSEAIDLLSRYAFEKLRLRRVYANVLDFNARARRGFEKAGFTVEGVLKEDRLSAGRPVDVYVLGRLAEGRQS
jgi:diamine N-acetyltransferase